MTKEWIIVGIVCFEALVALSLILYAIFSKKNKIIEIDIEYLLDNNTHTITEIRLIIQPQQLQPQQQKKAEPQYHYSEQFINVNQ